MRLALRVIAACIAAWIWLRPGAKLALFFYRGGHLGGTRWLFVLPVALLPLVVLSFWWPRTAAIGCWLVTLLYFFARWSEIQRFHTSNQRIVFVFVRSGTWELGLVALLLTLAALARPQRLSGARVSMK